jgi:DNA polymerase III subunit epsilon
VIAFRRRRLSPAARAYDRARRRDESVPWREARYAVVDLETTGLDPRHDEIVSFASVPIDGGRVQVGGIRTAIVRPHVMPDAETIRIHGLRRADLEDAPELPDVLDVILESLTGRVLVAHAAWVERGFLASALKPARLKPPEPVIDTGDLAARVFGSGHTPDGRVLALSDVARRLDLPFHRPHTADGDALTTAQVFLGLASKLEASEPQALGSLAKGR